MNTNFRRIAITIPMTVALSGLSLGAAHADNPNTPDAVNLGTIVGHAIENPELFDEPTIQFKPQPEPEIKLPKQPFPPIAVDKPDFKFPPLKPKDPVVTFPPAKPKDPVVTFPPAKPKDPVVNFPPAKPKDPAENAPQQPPAQQPKPADPPIINVVVPPAQSSNVKIDVKESDSRPEAATKAADPAPVQDTQLETQADTVPVATNGVTVPMSVLMALGAALAAAAAWVAFRRARPIV
jgi:hypothetical protein